MKLRIGAFDYELIYSSEEIEYSENGENLQLLGKIDHATLEITVWDGVHPQVIPATVLHEVVHGILRNSGLSEHPEEFVESVTLGLLAFSRDNPTAFHQIFNGGKP